jgi:two-component system, chemotaxis family, chemotaxis protein CheY
MAGPGGRRRDLHRTSRSRNRYLHSSDTVRSTLVLTTLTTPTVVERTRADPRAGVLGGNSMGTATRARPIRVAVIDDTSDIRELLRLVLSRNGMDVVGEAGDGRAGVELVRTERPDVVLLDLSMPVMDGLEALPLIRELVPDAQIIVLSAFAGAMSRQVLEWGADGYLVKGTPLREVVAYVEARFPEE